VKKKLADDKAQEDMMMSEVDILKKYSTDKHEEKHHVIRSTYNQLDDREGNIKDRVVKIYDNV